MRLRNWLSVVLLSICLASSASAATLTFTDTSGTERGFLVYIIRASGTIEVSWVDGEKVGTGQVQLTIQASPGDCFQVASGNTGGASIWTNKACLPLPVVNISNAPTTLEVKP